MPALSNALCTALVRGAFLGGPLLLLVVALLGARRDKCPDGEEIDDVEKTDKVDEEDDVQFPLDQKSAHVVRT